MATRGSGPDRDPKTGAAYGIGFTLRHANIVTVHELGEWQGVPFIAMEFLQGRSLECKRPVFPSGMTGGLRTTMSSWLMVISLL
jgi:hypothetical protein